MLRLPFTQQVSEFTRARQIADVLMRHGLGALAQQWELTRFLPRGRRAPVLKNGEAAQLTTGQRVRLTIEELGPTFIKLGQIAATRADIFPADVVHELEKLLDSAPPVAFEEIRGVIQAELREPIETLFAEFDAKPLAAASIGQAHRAQMHTGERVVVKIQRPNIEQVINADLDLMLSQARFLQNRSTRVSQLNLVALVEEFAFALRNELDYTSEGRNADRIRRQFGDDSRILIPKIFWSHTTRRVIVSEELHGIKLNDLNRLRAEGYDLPAVAQMGTEIYMQQIFAHAFFHADPHPANLFVVGNKIAMIDFGTMGFLSDELKTQLADLLVGLVNNDVEGIAQAMVHLGGDVKVNESELRRDVQRFMIRYYGLSLRDVRVSDFMGEVFKIANKHHIFFPADFALLGRTLTILEGVARQLDPNIVLVEVAKPFVTQLVRERYTPQKLSGDFVRSVREASALTQTLPRRLDGLLTQLERGELQIRMSQPEQPQLTDKLDTIANRLAFGLIVSASIVGSALLIQSGHFSFTIFGMELPIAQLSFLFSTLMGAWLLWSIVRSKGL
jgi:ubiquinone biosynthesis protein